MMGDARLVGTGTTQERPRVDDECSAAHRSQVRGSETARRATADENGVKDTAGLNVHDRLVCPVVFVDYLSPLRKRNGLLSNIHGRTSRILLATHREVSRVFAVIASSPPEQRAARRTPRRSIWRSLSPRRTTPWLRRAARCGRRQRNVERTLHPQSQLDIEAVALRCQVPPGKVASPVQPV